MNYKVVLSRTDESREFKKIILEKEICNSNSIRVIPTYLGICGSDLFHYSNNSEDNICFGHEWIGRVSEVGSNVKHVIHGDIVTTSSTLGCGDCSECQRGQVNFCLNPIHLGSPVMGALMGEIVFNAFNARVLHSDSKSEVLMEVVAVAEEAIRLMKEETELENKNILIMGAGTVGLLIAYLLKKENISVKIIDPHQSRVDRAKKMDISAMSSKHFLIMGEDNSFDVIFDATSDRKEENGGMSLWTKFAKTHHHILVIAKYLKPVQLNMNGLSKLGGHIKFMRGVPLTTMDFTIKKWSSKLDELSEVLISHEFDLNNIQEAFDTALTNSIAGKVIVKINEL